MPVKADPNATELRHRQYLDACFGFARTLLFVGIHFSGLPAVVGAVIRRSTSQSCKEAHKQRETEDCCYTQMLVVTQQRGPVAPGHTHAGVAGGASLRAAWGKIRVSGPRAGRAWSVLQTASLD